MYRIVLSIALVATLAGCSQILGLEPATQRPSDAMTSPSDASFDAPIDALLTGCASYCDTIAANCTGTNAQYGGVSAADALAHCMPTCLTWSPSGAMTGATLGCHIDQAIFAKTDSPSLHCPYAGPAGDQVNGAGVCGAPCTNFCSLEIATCGLTGANAQYASMNDCLNACAGFDKTHPYTVDATTFPATTPTGDSLACRLYHTTNALISASAAATHCSHTKAVTTSGQPCFGAPMP
jgi:hypothetical protein